MEGGSERFSASPYLSRSHKSLIWLGLGLTIVLLLVASSSPNMMSASVDAGNSTPSADKPHFSGIPLPSTSASQSGDKVINELKMKVKELEEEVKKASKISADVAKFVSETNNRLERVEDAAFSDGSNAFIAVMENAFFSPTGKRWVKLCDWEGCQFQSLAESATSLLKRIAGSLSKISEKSPLRAVHLTEACPTASNPFSKALEDAFGKDKVLLAISAVSPGNCTSRSAAQLLESLNDKTLDAVVVQGNGREETNPIIEAELKNWFRKLRVGGVVLGQDYIVSKPFNERWKKQFVATAHEKATKRAVDQYRNGDDNELGQEDTVRVAGGSLWYFTKIKPSIFGR